MITKAIEKIQQMVLAAQDSEPREVILQNGKVVTFYRNAQLSNKPDAPETLTIHSLSSLIDYIKQGIDCQWDEYSGRAIIVDSPTQVRLIGDSRIDYSERPEWVRVVPMLPDPFPFGKWMDGETFIIGLQSKFVHDGLNENDDWQAVANVVTGIRVEDGTDYKDDGVSQTVTVQRGVSLKDRKVLPNPVKLTPYRTFPEVEQPTSSFVLRVSDGKSDVPTLMLTDADGGAWRLEAMHRIKKWLTKALEEISSDIPVLG